MSTKITSNTKERSGPITVSTRPRDHAKRGAMADTSATFLVPALQEGDEGDGEFQNVFKTTALGSLVASPRVSQRERAAVRVG